MGLGGSVLAEPRFAVEYIAAIGHLEADQVLTTMMFADELPSEVIQQTAEFDVVATLAGEDVAAPVGDTFACVFVMTVGIDRTGTKLTGIALGLARRVEGTGTYLGDEAGSLLVVGGADAEQTLCLDEHGIGEAIEGNIVAIGALVLRNDFVLHEAIAFLHVCTWVVDGVYHLRIVEVAGARPVVVREGDGVACLWGVGAIGILHGSILDAMGPGQVETLVLGIVGVDELRDGARTVPG